MLLILVTCIQLLYLESLRLRTRELPALQFFKEDARRQLGLETEDGAAHSPWSSTPPCAARHSLLPGVRRRQAWTWPDASGETVVGGLADHDRLAYLLPQVPLSPHRGAWLAPLAPVLRVIGAGRRPVVAVLGFLQSLVDH